MKDMNYNDTEEMTWLKRTGGYDSDKTLRDTIAIEALKVLLNYDEVHKALADEVLSSDKICRSAYAWADVMLKVRTNV